MEKYLSPYLTTTNQLLFLKILNALTAMRRMIICILIMDKGSHNFYAKSAIPHSQKILSVRNQNISVHIATTLFSNGKMKKMLRSTNAVITNANHILITTTH